MVNLPLTIFCIAAIISAAYFIVNSHLFSSLSRRPFRRQLPIWFVHAIIVPVLVLLKISQWLPTPRKIEAVKIRYSAAHGSRRPWVFAVMNNVASILQLAGVFPPWSEVLQLEDYERMVGVDSSVVDEDTRTNFRRYLAAITQHSAQMNLWGCFLTHNMLITNLRQRYLLHTAIQQNPEILAEKIVAPIIITGLPRTGSSALFDLMACDPTIRGLKTTDAFMPMVDAASASFQLGMFLQIQSYFCPDLQALHPISTHGYEECIMLHAMTGMSFLFAEHTWRIPSYTEWFETQVSSFSSMYQFEHQVLQYLQWRDKSRASFLLKAPAHLLALKDISTQWPDARIVWTHRDPAQVVPSVCSLKGITRSYISCARQAASELGVEGLRVCQILLERGLASRRDLKESVFVDVMHEDFLADPLQTLTDIYESLRLPLNTTTRAAAIKFLALTNRQDFGFHEATLEQFGCNDFASAFEGYLELYSKQFGPKKVRK
jgi:hypothetical protein